MRKNPFAPISASERRVQAKRLEKTGKGLMFISLNVEPNSRDAAIAAVDALRTELKAKGVPVKEGS
jgi:hypothetical protein